MIMWLNIAPYELNCFKAYSLLVCISTATLISSCFLLLVNCPMKSELAVSRCMAKTEWVAKCCGNERATMLAFFQCDAVSCYAILHVVLNVARCNKGG